MSNKMRFIGIAMIENKLFDDNILGGVYEKD